MILRLRAVIAAALVVIAAPGRATAQRSALTDNLPYRNASLPVERRVDDLLARMTLDEKVAQMVSIWQGKTGITDAAGHFNPAKAPRWFRLGIGRIERPSDEHGARAEA